MSQASESNNAVEQTFSYLSIEHSPRSGRPWALFRAVARFPRASLLIVCVVQILVWLVTICLSATGQDVLPLMFDYLPIEIQNNLWYKRAVAAGAARLGRELPSSTNMYWNPAEYTGWINLVRIDLLYQTNDNILTGEKMAAIKRFEDRLASHKELHEFFDFYSLFRLAPADVDLNNHVASLLLKEAKKNETITQQLWFLLPCSFELNEKLNFAVSPMLRSVLVPKSYVQHVSEAGKRFRFGPLLSLLKEFGKNAILGSDVTFAYWGLELYSKEVSDQALKDALLAIGSLLFILLVILLHTGSAAMTGAALFGILTALATANLIYRYVLGYRYIGVFHAISVFLLLGIGADDVFVLFDAWCDSFGVEQQSEAHRLSWVLRRAGGATLFTSLTSALAFFVNAACSVPLVSTFGVFTGIAVLANYVILLTFLPCVLLNLHNICGQSNKAVCRPKWKRDRPRGMARVFEEIVFPFFRVKGVSIACLVVCGVVSCIFIWQTTLLKPQSSMMIQMFRSGSNYARAETMESYMSSYRPAEVTIAFGPSAIPDRSMCGKDNFKCRGRLKWVSDLDLNVPGAQEALLRLCRRLRTDPEWRRKLHLLKDPQNPRNNYVRCFVDDFNRESNLTELRRCPGDPGGPPLDLSVPIGREKIERLLQCYPNLLQDGRKSLSQNFSRFYESALSTWLIGNTSLSDYATNNIIMTFKGGDKDLGERSGRLRLAVISAYTDLTVNSGSFITGMKIRDNWESIIGGEIAQLPTAALRQGFQCTPTKADLSPLDFWQWFDILAALWQNAQAGLLSGLFGVALPILFIATRNVVLAIAGVLCLAFATGGVISMANAFGWSLGVTESINLAIVTGLSVDYVVHFIEAYHQASGESRERQERVRKMLVRVGGAVSSGVFSTLGAIMFLFGSQLRTFVQFGVFLGSTIFFAFFAAIFILTPFLMLMGPQDGFGSLDPILSSAWKKLNRRSRGG